MFTIKKYNKISGIINDCLDSDSYKIMEEGEGDCDAILVRSKNLHDEAFPKSLLAIGRAGAGVNNIPLKKCSELGIVVFNSPGANANAVKELVICGMLLAGRNIVGGINWLKEEHSKGNTGISSLMEKYKSSFSGHEISGKTLGIVGLGAIGVKVANAASALGMKVIGFDPFLSLKSALKLNTGIKIEKDIKALFSAGDYITLHTPLNPETKGFINDDVLASAKKQSVLMNFAREGLVDEDAVIHALGSGKLRLFITDFPTDRLMGTDGVLAFPHIGASTPEAEENCAQMAAEEIDNYLRYGNIRNSVNFPAIEMPYSDEYRISILNRNIKNMVGQITSVLAGSGLNIEHMANRSMGEYASTLIDTDNKPDHSVLDKLSAIDGVIRVRLID